MTYEKFLSFFSKEKDKMVGLVGLNGEEGFLQVLFFLLKGKYFNIINLIDADTFKLSIGGLGRKVTLCP